MHFTDEEKTLLAQILEEKIQALEEEIIELQHHSRMDGADDRDYEPGEQLGQLYELRDKVKSL